MTKRQLFALVAVLALLFAQVSSAAYACMAAVDMHAATMSGDCAGHSPDAGDTVCALHCDVGASLPATHSPDVAPIASAVLVLQMPGAGTPCALFVPSPQRNAMATAPPAAIRYCRLLI